MKRTLTILLSVACLLASQTISASPDEDFARGVEAYKAGNFQEAWDTWLPLAEGGMPTAQYNLGLLLEFGYMGDRDLAGAVEWYGQAAHNGEHAAQLRLGELYLDGVWGNDRQDDAVFWLRKSAALGNQEAINLLYEIGVSVEEPEPEDPLEPEPGFASTGYSDSDSGPRVTVQAGTCEARADRETEVQVNIEIPAVPIDHSLSVAQLTQKHFHGAAGSVLGLMDPELEILTDARPGLTQHEDHICFWLEEIEVELVYKSIQVFIAREYRKNSCEYKAILRHEKEHVEIARDNLERYKPKIRYALTSLAIPGPRRPARVASADDIEPYYQSLFKDVLQPVYTALLEDLRAGQAAIDTPQSYAKVHARCSNW